MRLTVAVPLQHRSSLEAWLGSKLCSVITWTETDPADVVVGLPSSGALASCPVWPGVEGAAALVEVAWARCQDRQCMEQLHEVGRALASEQNLDRLLEMILVQARKLLDAEAGSIYLVVEGPEGKELLFSNTQNVKVNLPYHRFKLPISSRSMAGFVASTGESLAIPDVYAISESSPYQFNDSFDTQAGYRSKSMLVVPLKDTEGEVLGVLQLINHVEEDASGVSHAMPFLAAHVSMAQSLAGQAGVAVKNAQLRGEIENLLEGFVHASVTAIEQRDPVTSGHSGRVAHLTVTLAEVVNATPNGPFGDVHFNERQLREIRYASLLHDFGKVGVREQVLVKSKKLEPMKLEMLLQRLHQRKEERILEHMREAWASGGRFDQSEWQAFLQREEDNATRLTRLIIESNEPALLSQESVEGLDGLNGLAYTHWTGQQEPLLDVADMACLRILRGSLSEAERREIESHVTHTFNFLRQIPWTRDLGAVPDIAYAHHERISGRGYPRQLALDAIPIQSRAMAIADVFDALTAQDRPYKAAVPVGRSLAILEADVREGHLDGDLLKLFIDAKVYEHVLS